MEEFRKADKFRRIRPSGIITIFFFDFFDSIRMLF